MDEKSRPDLFSQMIPDELEESLGLSGKSATEQNTNILVASLKAAAGQSGELVDKAVNQFLTGEGDLLDITRVAVTRSKTSAKNEVAKFLETRFKLSPVAAKLISMLLVKLLPSISELATADVAEKKKPRRKKKPKTTTDDKTAASTKKKPKKKKTTTRPKTTASKPAAKKKKTTAKGNEKETATKKKPKKKTRATTVAASQAED